MLLGTPGSTVQKDIIGQRTLNENARLGIREEPGFGRPGVAG
jgi:hypothetical protein